MNGRSPALRLTWLLVAALVLSVAGTAWSFSGGLQPTLAILVVGSAMLLLVWQRKQAGLYRELYEEEVSRQTVAESFDPLTRFANDVIVLADENGIVIEANERAEETYGYSRQEMIGLPLARLRAPEIQGQIGEDLRQLAAQGNFSYTANHIRKNGDVFPVEVRARYFVRGGHGFFHGIIRDVTERVAMVRQLRESEGRFRSIVESNPAAIHLYRLEPDNTLVFEGANPAADRMLGISHAQLVGLAVEDAWPGLAGTEAPDRYRDACRDGTPWSVEALRYDNGGIGGVFEVRAFQTAAGRAAVMFLDITEQQKAREAVRRSEESYRVAAEQTGQLLYDVDTTTGRIEWRGAITALTGYTPADYASVGIAEWAAFVHPDDRAAAQATFDEAVANRSEFRCEYRYRRRDGSYFLAEDHGVCRPAGAGEHVRALGTVRDVTAWRAAEEGLRQSEIRRQKLESLALLAGGIAHDFNNLLTGIVGNLSLAVHDAPAGSELRGALEEAERASLRARDLTRQLLTFSKGGAPIKRVADLGPLLRETVSFACRGTSVRAIVRLPEGPVAAEVDEGQIAQVINNLAINAVQAMPAGGSLTVSAALHQLGAENRLGLAAGRYARVTFTDTGMGVPRAFLERVFDPYFTTKQQGSGLGLAISHSIVARHGGAIGVNSEVGTGSVFDVYLPAAERAQAALPESPAGGPAVLCGRVLVMDDEEQVRVLALRMLQRLGFEPHGVRDGESAIAAYRTARGEGRPFAAVIMDLTVTGGMGGKEAVREVLASDPAARVIVSSGYSNDPVMASFGDYGFAAVLPKPYRLQQMKDTLTRVLG